MATHSSVLAWRISWMEKPGRLQSMGSHRVGQDWSDLAAAVSNFPGGTSGKEPACQCRKRKSRRFDPWVRKIPWRRKWQPTSGFLPGESHGQGSLVATVHSVSQSWTWLKRLSMPAQCLILIEFPLNENCCHLKVGGTSRLGFLFTSQMNTTTEILE